jgi:hypothetical protein
MALKSYLRSGPDPRRIPGLFSWYDFSDSATVTLDSGRIAGVRNKAQDAWHPANTSSGSTQPTYTIGGRNGLNVASFAAASSQRLQVPSSTSAFNFLHDGTPCWWIAVSSYGNSSNPNAYYFLFGNKGGGADTGFYAAFGDRNSIGENNDFASTVAGNGYVSFMSESNMITPQTAVVQEMLLDVTAAVLSNRMRIRVNGGTEIATNTYSGTASSANSSFNFTIGADAFGGFSLQGEIYEMLFFTQQPTAAARDLVRRYLGAKWGVSVA